MLKIQSPVTVSFWDKEAGPPEPQSRLIIVSVVPEAVKVNLPPSKLRIDDEETDVAPLSSVLLDDDSPAQEKVPVEESQSNLLEPAQ